MFEALREKLSSVFSKLNSKGKLSEADVDNALREVRRSLLEADVDYKVAKDLIAKIRERSVKLEVLSSITANERISTIVYEELISLMGKSENLIISPKPPTVILMAGLQGSGKTTTTVKLAIHLKNSHNPLVVACDLRRPAAVEQLRVLAENAKVNFYGHEGKNVLDVLREAVPFLPVFRYPRDFIVSPNYVNDVKIYSKSINDKINLASPEVFKSERVFS